MTDTPLRRRGDGPRRLVRRLRRDSAARVVAAFIALLGIAIIAVEVDHVVASHALDRARVAVVSATSALARSERALARSRVALVQARDATQATQIIQQSRIANCVDVNARHDATVLALDRLIAHAELHAGRLFRRQLEESRSSTLLLIGTLAPKRNCAQFVGP